ncbi:hypothetical protein ACWEV3_01115 [Saccharopolyspora sp. NPDC003752]
MTLQQLADRYRTVLHDRLGLETEATEHAMTFQREPFWFAIGLCEDDPEFLHLTLPRFFAACDMDRAVLLELCNETTSTCKGAALLVSDDDVVSASLDMLVAAPDCLPTIDHLTAVLPRAIMMVEYLVGKFVMLVELNGIEQASSDE